MATSNKKKSNQSLSVVDDLLNVANTIENKVKETKSVATSPIQDEPAPNITTQKSESPILPEEQIIVPATEAVNNAEGISILFIKKDPIDSKAIKIPSAIHQELKVLASILPNTTMEQMARNILEDFFDKNRKEISSLKKKMLK